MGEDFRCREVLQVVMIGYDVNGGAGPFEVVMPMFEGVVDGRKFFIMYIVISFGVFESPGVECESESQPGGSHCPGFGWTIRQLVCSQRCLSLP